MHAHRISVLALIAALSGCGSAESANTNTTSAQTESTATAHIPTVQAAPAEHILQLRRSSTSYPPVDSPSQVGFTRVTLVMQRDGSWVAGSGADDAEAEGNAQPYAAERIVELETLIRGEVFQTTVSPYPDCPVVEIATNTRRFQIATCSHRIGARVLALLPEPEGLLAIP